jgi:hypothetical protein
VQGPPWGGPGSLSRPIFSRVSFRGAADLEKPRIRSISIRAATGISGLSAPLRASVHGGGPLLCECRFVAASLLRPGQAQGLKPFSTSLRSVATLRVRPPLKPSPRGAAIVNHIGANTMNKIIAILRSILKSLTTKAKISISVALSIPGFLKVEVSYARDLTKPRKDEDA